MNIINLKKICKKWGLQGEINRELKAIFIPHASFEYSGLCAITAFMRLPKNIKIVYLLCTNHYLPLNDIIYKDNFNTSLFEQEHSYTRSYEMIKHFLPYAQVHSYLVGKYKNSFAKEISQRLNSSNTIVVATSDLIHYGPNFGITNFPQPEQFTKQSLESELILKLQKGEEIKYIPKQLACGGDVIKTLSSILSYNNLCGEVTNYYDSTSVDYNDILKTLQIHATSKSFVSYLSMVFSKRVCKRSDRFENLLALSRCKSVIEAKNISEQYFETPVWSKWNNIENGVFVGLSNIFNNIRCSIGQYESEGKKSSQIIVESAKSCFLDSIQRWGGPITTEELSLLEYKINLLQSKNNWKRYRMGQKIPAKRGESGVYIILKNGQVATYLPSVWKEQRSWSFNTLLENLVTKALDGKRGNLDQIYEIQLYTTKLITL